MIELLEEGYKVMAEEHKAFAEMVSPGYRKCPECGSKLFWTRELGTHCPSCRPRWG